MYFRYVFALSIMVFFVLGVFDYVELFCLKALCLILL